MSDVVHMNGDDGGTFIPDFGPEFQLRGLVWGKKFPLKITLTEDFRLRWNGEPLPGDFFPD